MAKDFNTILSEAQQIKNEIIEGANTALRTGTCLEDIVQRAEVDEDLAAKKARTITAGNGLTGGGSLATDMELAVGNTDDSIIVGADGIKVDTQDSLTSTSITKPLSAAKGKVLQDNKVDKTITVNGYPLDANVILVKTNVGLSNVDNTSDVDKPISTPTQNALNLKADLIGGKIPSAQLPANEAKEIADLSLQGATERFDEIIEDADILSQSYSGTDGVIVYVRAKNKFAYKVILTELNVLFYNNWSTADLFMNSSRTEPLKNKIYILDKYLYVFDDSGIFVKVDDWETAISILTTKTDAILECSGILESGETTDVYGLYLQEDAKGKIRTLTLVKNGVASTVTPEIGKFYLYNELYYGYSGKELSLIGGGSGSGSGSGFFNVTKEVPLTEGFYTLSTAVEALRNADIDDEEKSGMIITFEVSDGNWEDYRFEGTDISTFYDVSAWKTYGGKGAIKQITVSRGASTNVLTPDESGNVNLDIPVVEVDETIDENSTNPVENKAVAAEFKGVSGKYGAALRLNTIGEGDEKEYSLSLLTENGDELSTSETFTGGGGGSVVTTKIVLTRLTPNPTVKNGDTVELSYLYDQIDTTTGESTGNSAKVTVTIVRGATSSSFEQTIPAGSTQKIDVTKYIDVGTNNVRVRAEVGEGEEKQVSSISWTVSVVQLTLTSSFNIATTINKGDKVNVPYALTGSGTKTLRCYIDGVDYEDRSITTSTSNGSFNIDTALMSHGAHSVQMVAELELADGSIIKSNSIYFDIAVRESGNTTPIIATRFDYQDGTIISGGNRPYIPVKQYDNYTLTYASYNPKETPTTVEIYEAGTLISSAKVSFITTKLSLRAMNYGVESCKFVCGTTQYLFNLNVTNSDLNIVEPTDGMQLKLTAQGRSNDDTNREEWTYENVTTEFSGFNWGGDGWINNALRHTGDARSIVKYKPLEQPLQNANNAFTFLIKYKASEVTDDSSPIIKCLDENGTGFIITPTEARMVTKGKAPLAMKMAADQTYEVGFVSYPKAVANSSDHEKLNTEMVYLYINGIMSGCVQRGTSDNIYQTTPQYIELGANGATTDVYSIRCYGSYLSDSQMLDCYIIDQESSDAMFDFYNRNNIIDGNGNISVDNVPDDMRYVIVTAKEANGVATLLQAAVTNNKSTKFNVDEIMCIKRSEPALNFRLIGGSISLQGTSSLAYPIKNYRIYLRNANKVDGQLYLGCDSQGVGGELQSKAKYSFKLVKNGKRPAPVNCFCLKTDYAESSSSHNTGMAKLSNDTLVSANEMTPVQKYALPTFEYDVRTTVDGEPCLLFYRETLDSTPVLIGKYNFNNDKSTESVFGFLDIPGYHDQAWIDEVFAGNNPTECWEFLNNDYPMGSFLDADFDARNDKGTPKWMDVFDARFPDDDDRNAAFEDGSLRPTYLEAIVKWVKSTQTNTPKFKAELSNYFDVNYLCDYYMFTEIFGCVDQRVKNMMMGIWYNPDASMHQTMSKMRAYMIFYDCDTILGVRNDGRLKYSWDIDENSTDQELSTVNKTVYAYAGHDSLLWENLRIEFKTELQAAYRRIRAKMSNDSIFNMFDKEQSAKFCERVYNLDAQYKYVRPKTIGVEVVVDGVITNAKYSYLEAMQGSRGAHRKWWVTNRMHLLDARYSTGQYTATDITWKGNSAAGATVKATPSRNFYFELRREGDTMVHSAVSKNAEWSYTYGQTANIGTIFHLLGGVFMKSLNLSEWGGFTDMNIPTLPILEELILGKVGSSYTLTELVIGTKLPMLKTLDIRNYTKLPALDLSGCHRIEEVNASGCDSLSTIPFAEGCPLRKLYLPTNYQTLTLRSLSNLAKNNIIFQNKSNLTGLWIENCAQIDGFEMFKELFNFGKLKYVRLTGLSLEGTGSDLAAWFDAGLGGIDTDGNTVGKCKLIGTYKLTKYLDDATHAKYVAHFDELNIRQPQYTMIEFDDSVSDDKNVSNLDNGKGYKYGNDYQPSAHVSTILSKRFRCLGKQGAEGKMIIYPLHNANSNYYADAVNIENCTLAQLNSTEGDAFVFEPRYWYKGINDFLNKKHYSCYSTNTDMPDRPTATVITYDELIAQKSVMSGYKLMVGKPDIASSLSVDSKYSVVEVDVSKHKKVRFPTAAYTLSASGIFTDTDGNILSTLTISALELKFEDGMYLIADIPQSAAKLRFTIYKDAEFDCVVLSNSDKIEDMEPDWCLHEECLIGLFESSIINSKLRSCITGGASVANLSWTDFNYYSTQRKMPQIDYEMHKHIANLFFAAYGRRDSQAQCGAGSNANMRITGGTAPYGMVDTIGFDAAKAIDNTLTPTVSAETGPQYSWYKAIVVGNATIIRINNSCCLGYEDIYGDKYEMMDNVSLPNDAGNVFKWLITMPDGSQRKVKGSQVSGNFITSVAHGKFMDVIPVGTAAGSSSTHYCDMYSVSSSASRVVFRSCSYAFSYGGVSMASAGYDSSSTGTSFGSRLWPSAAKSSKLKAWQRIKR